MDFKKDIKKVSNNKDIKGTNLADSAFFIAEDCNHQSRKILQAIARIRAIAEEILETRKILRELSKL